MKEDAPSGHMLYGSDVWCAPKDPKGVGTLRPACQSPQMRQKLRGLGVDLHTTENSVNSAPILAFQARPEASLCSGLHGLSLGRLRRL